MKASQNKASSTEPVRVLLVDIDKALPDIPRQRGSSVREYTKASIWVRLHERLLGNIEVKLPPGGLMADELALQIWQEFEQPIREHLSADGILMEKGWTGGGLASHPFSICEERADNLLGTAPFISVVIATRNRLASLQECLQSILALDYPNFEVIVVDNAPSSEETAHFFHTTFSGSRKVRYLREDIPGLAVAHNRALVEVNAPLVAFTDDDVLVDPLWLRALASDFQRDPEVACVTGMILPYELGTLPQLWLEQFSGFGKGCRRIEFDLSDHRPDSFLFPFTAGQFGSGANMAFRTSVLKALGGFDPALGTGTVSKGGDDLAVFFDVVTKGFRLVYEPDAILYHRHRRDYAGLADQAYGYGVGLSAFLMRTVLANPQWLVEMLRKIPAGLKYLLDPCSPKNNRKRAGYPKQLTRLELSGFLAGPFAYLRCRNHTRKIAGKLPRFKKIPDDRTKVILQQSEGKR